jgi:hypothetical protein
MEKVNNLFVLVLAVMVAETRERKNGGKKERAGVVVVVVGRGTQGEGKEGVIVQRARMGWGRVGMDG